MIFLKISGRAGNYDDGDGQKKFEFEKNTGDGSISKSNMLKGVLIKHEKPN